MRSIRSRLFMILMITTGVVWMSAIVWIYLSTRHEVERVLDARLIEAARMVSSLITSQEIDPKRAAQIPTVEPALHASYDRQLSCQIWALDGTLVGRSDAAPATPLTESGEGFSQTLVGGEIWRVYAVMNSDLGMRVLVGDNMRVRDRLVADVIRGLALPALLILPILAGLIWLSVRKGACTVERNGEHVGDATGVRSERAAGRGHALGDQARDPLTQRAVRPCERGPPTRARLYRFRGARAANAHCRAKDASAGRVGK